MSRATKENDKICWSPARLRYPCNGQGRINDLKRTTSGWGAESPNHHVLDGETKEHSYGSACAVVAYGTLGTVRAAPRGPGGCSKLGRPYNVHGGTVLETESGLISAPGVSTTCQGGQQREPDEKRMDGGRCVGGGRMGGTGATGRKPATWRVSSHAPKRIACRV